MATVDGHRTDQSVVSTRTPGRERACEDIECTKILCVKVTDAYGVFPII